jgi:hypothetical protein
MARLSEDAAERVVRATNLCGEDLLGRSQRLAPIEEGTLRASAALALIVGGHRFEGPGALVGAIHYARELARLGHAFTVEAEVSFNEIYAARQHEELTWQHPKGGQAKYLETPHRARASAYGRIIGDAVR